MSQTASSRSLSSYSIHILRSLCILLLIQKGIARTFKVRGDGKWNVSSYPKTNTYNDWAQKTRFQIGDTLVFVYPAANDSVLLVKERDYTDCITAAPLGKFNDGNTRFSFNHSGPFYFISGVYDNCKRNEKMVVIVMADRSRHSSPPSPSPSDQVIPPSPAPAGEVAAPPSPPPADSTQAPSQKSNPPKINNSAASIVTASIGALVGSSIILAF